MVDLSRENRCDKRFVSITYLLERLVVHRETYLKKAIAADRRRSNVARSRAWNVPHLGDICQLSV